MRGEYNLHNQIRAYLEKQGFSLLTQKENKVLIYITQKENETAAIMLIDYCMGNELTGEQYRDLLWRTESYLRHSSFALSSIISIIVTAYPESARGLCNDDDSYWIADIVQRRLIIYESQPGDFVGIRAGLERAVQTDMKLNKEKGFIRHNLSLCNTAIILLNVVIFIIVEVFRSITNAYEVFDYAALSWIEVLKHGEYYRLITHMFLHADIEHLFNNMLLLFFIGSALEGLVKKYQYLLIYFFSGIAAGVVSIVYSENIYNQLNSFVAEFYQGSISVGASGAIFGVVGAFAYIAIKNKGKIDGFSSRRMLLFIVLSLYSGFTSQGIDNAAHVGGLVSGFLLAIVLFHRFRIKEAVNEG